MFLTNTAARQIQHILNYCYDRKGDTAKLLKISCSILGPKVGRNRKSTKTSTFLICTAEGSAVNE